MKKIFKTILPLAVLSFGMVACQDETEPQGSYATTDQMARSSSATEALLSAIPASFNDVWDDDQHYSWGYGSLMHIRDIMTEDLAHVESNYDWYNQWSENYYIGREYRATQFVWNYYYKMVLTANNLISGLDPEVATTDQLGYLGVGYAFRAMMYLDMARMYEFLPNEAFPDGKNEEGNNVLNLTCPIVKAGMSEDSARVNPRATREEMKAFIESDLQEAEKYIVNLSDTRGKTLPDLAAVYGLEARLYMWVEDYAKAEEAAKKAISASTLTPITQAQALDPSNGFNTTTYWMWGSTQTAESPTVESGILNWTSWLSNETQFGYASAGPMSMIGKSTYDRISDKDWRKLYWKAPAGSALEASVPYLKANYKDDLVTYASIKFRPGSGDDAEGNIGAACSYPLMRVEEMYLIQAEAVAQQGRLEEAKSLINAFMKTRNADYNCTLSDKDAIVEEIVFQKRLNYSVKRGYEGTNFYELCRFNTNGRPAWMNFVIVRTEENNNSAVNGYNNPDPSDYYTPIAD